METNWLGLRIGSGSVWSLDPDALARSLDEMFEAEARLAELKAALIRQAEMSDLASRDGAVNTTAWLRGRMRLTASAARGEVQLARALADHEATRMALAAGRVSAKQAQVITAGVSKLPRSVTADLRVKAEEHLIAEAQSHHPRELQVLAAHLIDVIDPDHADARLAVELERLEAKAARESFFDIWHDEHTGTSQFHGRLPLFQGIKLARMIDALTNPARGQTQLPLVEQSAERASVEGASVEISSLGLPATERRGRALTELVDRLPVDILPKLGRNNATVVVTMTLDTLRGGLQAAGFDTGHQLSPGLARKLAAEAGVIPAVLGTRSQVLDLGRRARLFSNHQRLAMRIQQHGKCGAEGCDRPAAWAQANHLTQWQHHGATDLVNGILLCSRHHTLADHKDYTVERLSPAQIRIRKKPGVA